MLGLIVLVLLIGGALMALLWAGTLWFQAYIYSEPAEELYWCAPAAAAALTLVLVLWCWLAYRHPGYFDLLSSSPRQLHEYPQFWSVEKGKGKVLYERRKSADLGSNLYYARPGSRTGEGKWRRETESGLVEAIIVEEGPQKKEVRYKLQRPPGDKFGPGDEARYVEEGGRREMTEGQIGRVDTARGGSLLVYLLINVLHFAVWFASLWLLLRFQWSHALGLAVVFWLIMTFAIVPLVVQRTEQVAPPPSSPTASWQPASTPDGLT